MGTLFGRLNRFQLLFKSLLPVLFLLPLLMVGVGCGYGFQSAKDSSLKKYEVEKIFVRPIVNRSFKPGVENVVYNALVRSLRGYGRVVIVPSKELADGILEGSVNNANYTASGSSYVSSMTPAGVGGPLPTSNFPVAGSYSASLECYFRLLRIRHKKPQPPDEIWAGTFAASVPFAAANQLDVPGTTSAIINESEFDRALSNMARDMMDDVNNSMVAGF